LDIVVALDGEGGWWGPKSKLGLFLQRRTDAGLLYKIVVDNGQDDCYARVERATATDVVLSCTPEKGGPGLNRKFVYDIRAKALVKRVEYDPFAMRRIFVSAEKAVLVGADHRRLIVVEYDPGREPSFRLLAGAEAEPWMRRAPFTTGTVGAGAEQRSEIYVQPREFKPVHFGPEGRFTFPDSKQALLVVDRNGEEFQLPQSTYGEFRVARPERVKDGYSREATAIEEIIGPWQIADGTLWFAKTFYDGEGTSGVGGFGFFDSQARKYRVYSPAEVRNWSATAMLVESDSVWLALAINGEGWVNAGGVVRFNRATQKVDRFGLREIVWEIARVSDRLVMATQFGAAVFDGEKLRRFFIDETTDGRLRVAEAIPGTTPTEE
jgi:hypothetical protein